MSRARLLLAGLLAFAGALVIQPAAANDNARERAQIHTELGSAYYSRGQLGVALEELTTAIKADSSYAPAYNVLGLVYMELREDAQAKENFERSLSLDPADSDAHNNYGWFLCQRDQVDASIKHFMAALKNPLYAYPDKPYVNAGICSRKKGQEEDAEGFFLKALKFQPQHPLALYNLADIYYERGAYAEAKTYVDRLTQLPNASAESLWLALRVERRLGNRDAEANYGLQLRQRFPGSREAQALRNEQYDQSGGSK